MWDARAGGLNIDAGFVMPLTAFDTVLFLLVKARIAPRAIDKNAAEYWNSGIKIKSVFVVNPWYNKLGKKIIPYPGLE